MKLAIAPLIIFAMAVIVAISSFAAAQEKSGTLAGEVLGLSGEQLPRAP